MGLPMDILVVAVGVQFFGQRARQHLFCLCSGQRYIGQQSGEVRAQSVQEIVVVLGELREQECAWHLKNLLDFRVGDDRPERLQTVGDMFGGRLRQGADLFPRYFQNRLEEFQYSFAHVRNGRDHGCSQPLAEGLNVDVQALLSGFIDTVQSDDKRAAEKAQLKA